jgi:hypothetical protein
MEVEKRTGREKEGDRLAFAQALLLKPRSQDDLHNLFILSGKSCSLFSFDEGHHLGLRLAHQFNLPFKHYAVL